MIVVMLLIVLPGMLSEARTPPAPLLIPPSLDACLASVRAATPPTARILVAGAPPSVAFYRATAALYPRRIYSAFATDFAHAWATPSISRPALMRLAYRDDARYVLLWALPLKHIGKTRVRCAAGALEQVVS